MLTKQINSAFRRILFIKEFQINSTRCVRNVPKTLEEYQSKKSRQIEQPADPKLLRVAIVGCPNAGKSTLMNEIIKWKVSCVSSKVHTTRKNTIGVFSEGDTQIEFVDTPGIVDRSHIKRHELESTFKTDPAESSVGVDLIAYVSDISNSRERFHINRGILKLLSDNRDKESILVLNKIDKIEKKRSLIDYTAVLTSGIVDGKPIVTPNKSETKARIKHGDFEEIFEKTEKELQKIQNKDNEVKISFQEDGVGWPNFSSVFMVSALHNDGIEYLRNYLISRAQRRPWLYNEDSVTTLPPRELIIDAVRGVCLEFLYEEIPYKIQYDIIMWQVDELNNLHISIDLYCPERFQSLIIGLKGANISRIVRKSRETMCNIFHCDVSLKIAVKPLKKK